MQRKITINFSEQEFKDLETAAKDVEFESYCKVAIMVRAKYDNVGSPLFRVSP